MNYKTVSKKKKKNTALLVVVLVLSLVLVGGAVAGIGYAFDWWNFGKEANDLPTSTFNVNVDSLDDIYGIEIKTEDFASYVDQTTNYEAELKAWEENGSVEENKPQEPETYFTNGVLLLNVNNYGVDFKLPESGLYDITLKVNGEEYTLKKVAFDADSDEFYLSFTSDFEGNLTEENLFEGDVEGGGFMVMMSDTVAFGPTAYFGNYCFGIMISYYSEDKAFESFELVSFEKVAKLPVVEETEDCTAHVDENGDGFCDECGEAVA